MVTAISLEVFPGVLQTEQKHIGKWREAIEAEMKITHSVIYRRPSGARYSVGSTSTNVQEQKPSAFRSRRCEKYDCGSNLLSAKLRETNENVEKILRVTVQNVLSSSRENDASSMMPFIFCSESI